MSLLFMVRRIVSQLNLLVRKAIKPTKSFVKEVGQQSFLEATRPNAFVFPSTLVLSVVAAFSALPAPPVTVALISGVGFGVSRLVEKPLWFCREQFSRCSKTFAVQAFRDSIQSCILDQPIFPFGKKYVEFHSGDLEKTFGDLKSLSLGYFEDLFAHLEQLKQHFPDSENQVFQTAEWKSLQRELNRFQREILNRNINAASSLVNALEKVPLPTPAEAALQDRFEMESSLKLSASIGLPVGLLKKLSNKEMMDGSQEIYNRLLALRARIQALM